MSVHNVQVRAEGAEVVLILDGKGMRMPWQKADEISTALRRKARLAEEVEMATQVIADNALLQRSGAIPGLGLSDHPAIRDETVKEALYGRDLRRHLPAHDKQVANGIGGIQTRGAVGAPTLGKVPCSEKTK